MMEAVAADLAEVVLDARQTYKGLQRVMIYNEVKEQFPTRATACQYRCTPDVMAVGIRCRMS
jgi:hypothetical protein